MYVTHVAVFHIINMVLLRTNDSADIFREYLIDNFTHTTTLLISYLPLSKEVMPVANDYRNMFPC